MIFPNPIKAGDTIGVVAPSFPLKEEQRDACVRALEDMGYKVKLGEVLKKLSNFHNYLAGEGALRAADINNMFADTEVKAIICARGGYGSAYTMEYLDYDLIRRNPKIFVGYSDITNLLMALNMKCDLVTFHGPLVWSNIHKHFDQYTRESLFAAWNMQDSLEFYNPPEWGAFHEICPGAAEGMLCGGNISLISRAIGTPYGVNTDGKILFLEEIEETIPSIDMSLTHIKHAGLLDHAAGVLLGGFTDCTNERYDSSYKINEFLTDWFGKLNIPVMSNVCSGHDYPMGTLPMGTICRMDTADKRITFYRG